MMMIFETIFIIFFDESREIDGDVGGIEDFRRHSYRRLFRLFVVVERRSERRGFVVAIDETGVGGYVGNFLDG